MPRSGTLEQRLSPERPGSPPGPSVGVEHELQAFGSAGRIDFRMVIGEVAGPVRLADPGDPRARRLASGAMLTADGWEAELATPPVPLDGEATGRIVTLLEAERSKLLGSLRASDAGAELVGFSTHLNVTVGDELVVGLAREFARRCAAAAMFLLDGPQSPGLLVRPRRDRLEVCGEYASGQDLAAALTFVAGAALMLQSGSGLPAVGGWQVEPARERYGHFVPRSALAADPRAVGRASPMQVGARRITVQQHMEEVWAAVRPFALAYGLDPGPVDDRVGGAVPVPAERRPSGAVPHAPGVPDAGPGHARPEAGATDQLAVFHPGTQVRRRPSLVLSPAWSTWSTVAWACHDARRNRTAYAVMPAAAEHAFLALVDRGRVDDLLRRAAGRRVLRRVLVSNEQTRKPGMWQDVRPAALVPAERDAGGVVRHAGGGSGAGPDRAKDRQDERSRPRRGDSPGPGTAGPAGSGRRFGAGMIALVLASVLVLGAAIWAITLNAGADDPALSAPSAGDEPGPVEPEAQPDTEPFTPGPEELDAMDLTGVYRLTRTVTESENLTAPLGTVETRSWTLTGCTGSPCTVSAGSAVPGSTEPPVAFELSLEDGRLVYRSETVGPCFDPATGEESDPDGSIAVVTDELTVSGVAWQGGRLVATDLAGTRFLTGRINPDATGCEGAEVLPVTYEVVAVRMSTE